MRGFADCQGQLVDSACDADPDMCASCQTEECQTDTCRSDIFAFGIWHTWHTIIEITLVAVHRRRRRRR